ncbi:hypothetical protein KL909_003714 [Ogataea angusta]|nr:hypothetical protein KL909_003714 [Ogataea angusta]
MQAHLQGEAVTHVWARVPELSEATNRERRGGDTGRVREFILETELRNQQGLVWRVLDIPVNLPSGSALSGTPVSSRFNGERNLKGYLQPHLASPSMAFPCSFARLIA